MALEATGPVHTRWRLLIRRGGDVEAQVAWLIQLLAAGSQFCEIIFCARFRVAWRRFRLVFRPGHLPGVSARAYARPAFSSSSVVLSVCQRPAGIPIVSRRRVFYSTPAGGGTSGEAMGTGT